MRRVVAAFPLVCAVVIALPLAFAQSPVPADRAPSNQCDALAAHPFDPEIATEGVDWDELDAEQAMIACEAAVEVNPEEPRFQFQFGRALAKAEQYDAAMSYYRKAAEQRYVAALVNIGALYEEGFGVSQDFN